MNAARAALMSTADAVLARREAREPLMALAGGRPARGFATLDAAALKADARFFGEARAALQAIVPATLAADEDAFRRALMTDLTLRIDAVPHRALDFVVTPYRGGDLHIEVREALAASALTNAEQADAYLALLADYARLLRELLAHTRWQAEQGLRLAAPALPSARAALRGVIDALPAVIRPAATRMVQLDAPRRAALERAIERCLEAELLPPLNQLLDVIGADYAARAPEGVGLHRYPGGDDAYRALVRRHADRTLEPDAIHRLGLDEIEALRATRECAPQGRVLPDDPRFRPGDAQAIEACFMAHMQRIGPLLPQWFGRLPGVPWAVTRADPAVEAGMTYGYFQRATPADPVGRYRYNGSRPETRSLIGAAHLIYHELLPGHHLQFSLQDQASLVHPLQRHLHSMASVEGWAVYASSLACEMGAIRGDDLVGHTWMQGFIAARLVVDTGLNALGWSLPRAHAFLREHTIESDTAITSELLRYGADIPAQALAYGLGQRAITQMREGAGQRLGARFDVRGFHDALLAHGAYPLPVLAAQVECWASSV